MLCDSETKSRAISTIGAECVIAPTATKFTPVLATETASRKVSPPLASKTAKLPSSATTAAISSRPMLSNKTSRAPGGNDGAGLLS